MTPRKDEIWEDIVTKEEVFVMGFSDILLENCTPILGIVYEIRLYDTYVLRSLCCPEEMFLSRYKRSERQQK